MCCVLWVVCCVLLVCSTIATDKFATLKLHVPGLGVLLKRSAAVILILQ